MAVEKPPTAIQLPERAGEGLHGGVLLGLENSSVRYRTQKGKFKPPVCKVFALQDGVPFERAYRSLKAAKKLEKKQGVTHFQLILLS